MKKYKNTQVIRLIVSLHDFYVSHFNLDDLTDRKWYTVEETHFNHHWKSKFVLGILCFTVYNTWVYDTKAQYQLWKAWWMDIAQKLYIYTVSEL
jgi:hypothetical protein